MVTGPPGTRCPKAMSSCPVSCLGKKKSSRIFWGCMFLFWISKVNNHNNQRAVVQLCLWIPEGDESLDFVVTKVPYMDYSDTYCGNRNQPWRRAALAKQVHPPIRCHYHYLILIDQYLGTYCHIPVSILQHPPSPLHLLPTFLPLYYYFFLPPIFFVFFFSFHSIFRRCHCCCSPEIVPDPRSVLVSPPLPSLPPTTSRLAIPTFPPATPCYVYEQVPGKPLRKTGLPTALVVSQEVPGHWHYPNSTCLTRSTTSPYLSTTLDQDYKNSTTARPIWWLHELAAFPAIPRPRPFPSTPAHRQPWPLGQTALVCKLKTPASAW